MGETKIFLRKSNIGFTFIELLIVITIMIIIASLSIPAVTNYQRKQAEHEEIKNFISTFRSTQNLALTTDGTYSMNFQNGSVEICPLGSTECKKITNDFLRGQSVIYIDRYGNLVDQNNLLISQPEVNLESNSFIIVINKFGRIYVKNK